MKLCAKTRISSAAAGLRSEDQGKKPWLPIGVSSLSSNVGRTVQSASGARNVGLGPHPTRGSQPGRGTSGRRALRRADGTQRHTIGQRRSSQRESPNDPPLLNNFTSGTVVAQNLKATPPPRFPVSRDFLPPPLGSGLLASRDMPGYAWAAGNDLKRQHLGCGPVLPPGVVQCGVDPVDGLKDLPLDEHLGVVVAQEVEALDEGGVVGPVRPVVGEVS
jgi:hypothetical protein